MITKLRLLPSAIEQFMRMELYGVYNTIITDYMLPINNRILHEMTKFNDKLKIGTFITILSIYTCYNNMDTK